MKNSPKEIKERQTKNWSKLVNPLKNTRKNNQTSKGNSSGLEKNRGDKENTDRGNSGNGKSR